MKNIAIQIRPYEEKEDLFNYDIYVAEHEGIPVGFIAFTQEEIAWLYVDVNLSRRGIGKQLLCFDHSCPDKK